MIGMKINKYELNRFSNLINIEGKKIICWGAGALPQLSDELFLELGILDNTVCFADNNPKKTNSINSLLGIDFPILSLKDILLMDLSDKIILITCENFLEVIEQLNNIEQLKGVECFAYVYLNYEYFKNKFKDEFKSIKKTKDYKNQDIKIPKTIHYFWFGKNQISEFHKECIESWKENCPEYEIIQWNETNYDITKNNYVRQAYESKKWAFVTDYARLDILYQYGGIYFDTDVKLIRNIDELLINEAFCTFGEWPSINSGSGIGAIKHHIIIKEMRDNPRSKKNFILQDGSFDLTQNGVYESKILKKHGLKKDFSIQNIKGMIVYPPDYFAPVSVLGDDAFVTKNTYGVHYCKGSWVDKTNRIRKF